jgi:hypothetical protein
VAADVLPASLLGPSSGVESANILITSCALLDWVMVVCFYHPGILVVAYTARPAFVNQAARNITISFSCRARVTVFPRDFQAYTMYPVHECLQKPN